MDNYKSQRVFVECTNTNRIIINESDKVNKNPIHIVLVYADSTFAKVVKTYTHAIYTHAGLSLDLDMDKVYSYNVHNNGFDLEHIKNYNVGNKSTMCVFTMFIDDKKFSTLKNKLKEFVSQRESTKYSFLNILGVIMNKPVDKNSMNMICSQFVDTMLKTIDIDIVNKASHIVTPHDLFESLDNRMYKVYEGYVYNYDKKNVQKTLDSIKKKGKTTRIDFDEDGNMFIQNLTYDDYEREFNKSNTLLKNYSKAYNIEGMKYELAKLYYMNLLLEDDIWGENVDPKIRKERVDSRARILNVFNKYLRIVMKHDKSFNFEEYYNNTPFSTNTRKVSKNTLKHGTDLIIRMSKVL